MQDGKTHPEFRLLLSSKPDPKFPITLLQTSMKVSTEQPRVRHEFISTSYIVNDTNRKMYHNVFFV